MVKKQDKVAQNEDQTIDLPVIDECFIITPIGEFNSETYVKAMGLISSVINPVLKDFGFKATPANEINTSGSINKQIIKRILEDKLAIANLTGLNPNVMYELALRHAARLPVITMAEKGTRLPFDITDQRTIFYIDSLAGSESAKPQLRAMIEEALSGAEPENPIYDVIQQESILKGIAKDDPINLLMNTVNQMEAKFMTAINDLKGREVIKPNQSLYSEEKSTFFIRGTFESGSIDFDKARRLVHALLLPLDSQVYFIKGSFTVNTFNFTFNFSKSFDSSTIMKTLTDSKHEPLKFNTVQKV